MKSKNTLGFVFVLMGAVLILSALSLWIYNRYEDAQARKASEELILMLKNRDESTDHEHEYPTVSTDNSLDDFIDSTSGTEPTKESEQTTETESNEMLSVEVDGHYYVGYISIPEFDLELPVASDWDYEKLQLSPCRHKGSTKSDDLVIMAHNYYHHFGRIGNLSPGSEVFITDMEDVVHTYTVSSVDKVDPEEADAILDTDHDLVLYTCTQGGTSRVTVYCDRAN